jgi:hypothetical protein
VKSAFLGSFGVKPAENRLPLAAPAFRTFEFFFPSLFDREGQGIFFIAFLTLELVVWHLLLSFPRNFCQLFVPNDAP